MARIVEDSSIDWGKGRKNDYPWDEWFDGQARLLRRGEDFPCKPHSMRAQAYNQGHKRGQSVRTKVISDDLLALQRM